MKKKNYEVSKKLEPTFSAILAKDVLEIEYMNLESITFKYYLIDPEVAFSKAPFLSEKNTSNDSFSFVKEVKSIIVDLDPNLKSISKQIEKEFIS